MAQLDALNAVLSIEILPVLLIVVLPAETRAYEVTWFLLPPRALQEDAS